jgi:hypothetical protein
LDKQFLEFWGNLLLSAARGQRQVEELSRWLAQGMSGFRELTAMFRKFYGLDSEGGCGADPDWHAACGAFEKAYRAYLDALAVVPRSEYIALQKQLDALQKKSEGQEAALQHLRLELIESRASQGDVMRGFQGLVQIQREQFQRLTESFGRFLTGQGTGPADREKT